MANSKERKSAAGGRQSEIGNIAGFTPVASHVAKNQAAASDIFLEGMNKFLEEAQKRTDGVRLKGNLFEYIEAAKFNRNAAAAGKDVRAVVTARDGGYHSPADIEIGDKQFQLKAGSEKYMVGGANDPKYAEMEVVIPSSDVDNVNQKLESFGEKNQVSGELESDGISSGGTKRKELDEATNDPKHYARTETWEQIKGEAIKTTIYAAGAAAVIGGAISAVKNGFAYRDGNIDGEQALANVGKDTVRSGVRGGATGALGVGVRHGARHLGIPMKSNVATAVAAAAIEVGVTVYDFAKGEISAEEAGERIGETGCSAAGGIYVGAAAGAIFGPPGAIVGSMVGYMATAWIYQSCIAVLKQARLAEEEAARLEVLCAEAVQELNRRQQEFESRMTSFLEERQTAFNHCFAMIDETLEADETDDAVAGLALLAAMAGSALKFEGFEEFKEFMEQKEDTPLVI